MNPPFITNLTYQDYVSEKELNQNKEQPKMPKRDLNNLRKTPFFNYYDSVVKNSHLFPVIKINNIKVYEPPKKPALSQLLKPFEMRASQIPNKILPRWD